MKSLKSLIKYTIISFAVVALFSSCEIGLGPYVDLQAPVITLDSHSDNDTVPESFVLYGTASDNEDVTQISISFEDAGMYYQVTPGECWQKKNDKTGGWVNISQDKNNFCTSKNGAWSWSVEVDTDDKSASKTDSSFSFTALASDALGNTSKKSEIFCSLVLDTSNPSVSIYSPEQLLTGTYDSVVSKTADYTTGDSKGINYLLNGNIELKGRIDNSLSFKGLRIEFDNGQLNSDKKTVTSLSSVDSIDDVLALEEAKLGDSTTPDVYFSKTLSTSDLLDWSLTVTPEEWATSAAGISWGLNTGKHIIRVVTTALSSSDAWERKIIGYFVWWPEADIPWITPTSGDTDYTTPENVRTESYPGSDMPGTAQDDDKIMSFTSSVYKADANGIFTEDLYSAEGYTNPKNYEISSDTPKTLNWALKIPSDTGTFKVVFEVKDYTGNTQTVTRYFKTSDVGAPKITVNAPLDGTSAIVNANGDLPFDVKVTDDTSLVSFAFIWLNPKNSSDTSNKIKYLTGTDSNWDKATEEGWTDDKGNKIYKINVESDGLTASINKAYNLFNDFGIDGNEQKLVSQDFIFRAWDGKNTTVKSISLTGDSITPEVSIESITLDGKTESLVNNIPTFPMSAVGKTAVISGKWSDKYSADCSNTDKFTEFTISWKSTKCTATKNADGTWTASISAPTNGGQITAKLQDFGGNSKTVQTAVNIESANLSLTRIGCQNDDGAYNAGKEINITLNFSKNTDVELNNGNKPSLLLNNGKSAEYVSGSGTSVHVYKYTVSEGDTNVTKLDVSKIVPNGAKWYDSSVTGESRTPFVFYNESSGKISVGASYTLGSTSSIKIDTQKPSIRSLTVLSSGRNSKYFKQGDSILLLMSFSEDITVSNLTTVSGGNTVYNLTLNFSHSAATEKVSLNGSNGILFTHTVAAGENSDSLSLAASQFTNNGVTVTDAAGNVMTSWDIASVNISSKVIDTTSPSAPSFKTADGNGSWNPEIVFDESGTSFTLAAGDSDVAEMDYSIVTGSSWSESSSSWTTYSGAVSVKNNGTYTVVARAIDNAENVSSNSSPVTFTVDKGYLLSKITAETASGTYKIGSKITGKIKFRSSVTLPEGSAVTLNVAGGSSVAITECKNAAATGSEFTFEYTVKEGDAADALEIYSWSLSSTGLTYSGKTITISVPDPSDSTDSKALSKNRTLVIDGVRPVVSGTPSVSDTTLTIPFDSTISKGSGTIVLTYASSKFYAPAVLTSSEYSELSTSFAAISEYYDKGTNGATVSGSTLVNDSSTKYILKFTKSNDDETLVAAFKDAGKDKTSIPVIVSEVSVSGKTMTIDLSSTYAFPVKGADYTLTIPAGAVTDEAGNSNDEITGNTIKAPGVEKPEIRIKKPDYTLYNKSGSGKTEITSSNWVSTASAYVDMSEVQYAKMFITCRTPDATIKYTATAYDSTPVKITNSRPVDESKVTVSVSVPSSADTEYTAENETNGVSLGKAISSYDTATGLKYAIAAQGTKTGFTPSELSYEYATRSVVKLLITGNYRAGDDAYDKTPFSTDSTFSEKNLILQQYRPWIMGGDSPSGANSIDTFPLSWSETGKYRFMAGDYNSTTNKYGYTATNNMNGKWYWVSWNIPSTTYIGFMVGDVPKDAVSNGPSHWVPADYHWVPMKQKYPLYPGEELIMAQESDSVTPMGASLAFGIKKKGSR